MKKTIFILALLVCTDTIYAQKKSAFNDGFYGGVQTGISPVKAGFSWENPVAIMQITNQNIPGRGLVIVPGTLSHPTDSSVSQTAVALGLFAGYRKQFHNLMLGAEAGFMYNPFTIDRVYAVTMPQTALQGNSPLVLQRQLKSSFQESVSGQIGIVKKQSWIYASVGLNLTHVTIKAIDSYNPTCCPKNTSGQDLPGYTYPAVSTEQQEQKLITGLTAGAGYEWKLNDDMSIGFRYSHVFNNAVQFTTSTASATLTNASGFTNPTAAINGNTVSIKLSEDHFMAKLCFEIAGKKSKGKSKKNQ